MNSAEDLCKIAEAYEEPQERHVYSIEEVYNVLIYPILEAAARNGEHIFTISRWSLKNILPKDIVILDILKYIQEEKNILVHSYGDTISFFW